MSILIQGVSTLSNSLSTLAAHVRMYLKYLHEKKCFHNYSVQVTVHDFISEMKSFHSFKQVSVEDIRPT